jgi:hypothetical protein
MPADVAEFVRRTAVRLKGKGGRLKTGLCRRRSRHMVRARE